MRLRNLVLVGLVALISLWNGSLQSADPPPRDELTFTSSDEAMVNYEVVVVVGLGNNSEQYKGTLRYEIQTREASATWIASGDLSGDPLRPHSRGLISFNTQSILDPVLGASSRFELSKYGQVISSSGERQLKLLLGDFTKWGIAPLPTNDQSEWERSEPIIVQQGERDPRFDGFMLSPLRNPLLGRQDNNRLSAGMEKTSYKITGTEGPITVIEHTYELEATHTDPPTTVTGQGTGRFDRRRGVFDQLQWTRNVVIQKDGAEIRVPVKVTLQRVHDFGLVPLTTEEKAEMERLAAEAKAYAESPQGRAEAAAARQRADAALAEAKRAMAEFEQKREAEAAAPFDAQERKAWIATLEAGKEYGDGAPIYSKLSGRSPRPDPELARALYEFANRVDGSLGSMFWDLAAKFDEDFAAVLPLRKAYSNSHTKLPDVGAPIPKTAKLREGQLVAVKQKHGQDYRAMSVVNQDDQAMVFVTRIGSSHIERVPLSELRMPAARVIPYLSEKQRPGGKAAPDQLTRASGPSAESAQVELRTWTDRSGRYSMTGRFVSLQNDVVRLEKADGTSVDVPISRLREADAEAARELANAANNPFRVVSP